MRGHDHKKGSSSLRMNIDDVCAAMQKFTDMTPETEIKGFENAHDMQLLIDEVKNDVDSGEVLRMVEIEESAKLLYKY